MMHDSEKSVQKRKVCTDFSESFIVTHFVFTTTALGASYWYHIAAVRHGVSVAKNNVAHDCWYAHLLSEAFETMHDSENDVYMRI